MEATYNGHIASADDALLLFEACRLGILKRRKYRLCESERINLASGSVYVWDEKEAGVRRWTDGKRWSPSRVSGFFLVYLELESRKQASNLSHMQRSDSSDIPLENGLIKKTLSLFTTQNSKLHMVCYYRKSDVDSGRLTSPSQDPRLCKISIPRSLYPDIMPEITRTNTPRPLPLAQRRHLSVSSIGIPVYGYSSLQQQQQALPIQQSKIFPYATQQTAYAQPSLPSYHRSNSNIAGSNAMSLHSSQTNSSFTASAAPTLTQVESTKTVESPRQTEERAAMVYAPPTISSPNSINLACSTAEYIAPHKAQRYSTATTLASIKPPANYRSFTNPVACQPASTLPTPPLQSPSEPLSTASSSRRDTLNDIIGYSQAIPSNNSNASSATTDRVRLPPISELLKSINHHRSASPISKTNHNANRVSADVRARYSGPVWNQRQVERNLSDYAL
ncbi:Gluconate transport-inducing protein [Coemansia brasiliensis]|uniref:Gluconate transport-inducing protein n=1 Tax=Coemansia brasiliensis TaxID=2650707 RepID=A0A9W8M011_9FUNG|nr:Gluconate transport-inducing protein [Coemansia brasiliensis]